MYREADKLDAWDAAKRLTKAQHDDARTDSGPGSTGPLLLKPLSRNSN